MIRPFGIIFSLALVSFLTSSCSIYKSQGRSQFESATPGKLQPQSINSISDTTLEDLNEKNPECWLQPSQESIWHLSANSNFSIKVISNQVIEVCEVTP